MSGFPAERGGGWKQRRFNDNVFGRMFFGDNVVKMRVWQPATAGVTDGKH